MSTHGIVHFDGRVGNVLADGRRVPFTGFGFALADTFSLGKEETASLAETATTTSVTRAACSSTGSAQRCTA
jgi:hypothetical protein